MGVHGPVELAKTVLEVADLAFTAVECCHHHRHDEKNSPTQVSTPSPSGEEEEERSLKNLDALQLENKRLRALLEQNLQILGNISRSPSFFQNCPSDLHERLLSAVSSESFLNKLNSNFRDTDSQFPFMEADVTDIESLEIPIYVEHNQTEPSLWVWISEDMAPNNTEEKSGIDLENYVVVSEDDVVDGVSNFVAKCIVSNPKTKDLTPKELQKSITHALGVNKVGIILEIWNAGHLFLTLGSWGLTLAGLYRSRAILRHAALGVHTASKIVLKAI